MLRHVFNVERSTLYAYPEPTLPPAEEQHYLTLIERRSQGEPVAYLTGHKEFYGLDFLVDQRVLIPRPETELLVEAALNACQSMLATGRTPAVADIGTGSRIIPAPLPLPSPPLPSPP